MLATLRSRSRCGDLRLQDVVGAGRAAAEMALRHVAARRSRPAAAAAFGCVGDLLAVLHRAGGVVGDGQVAYRPSAGGRPRSARYSVTSLASAETRAAFCRVGRVVAEHVAVVLDRGAAARRGDHDRVEPAAVDLAIQASMLRLAQRVARRASLPMWWTSAPQQPSPARQHDLDAEPGQQADGRLVDLGARAPAGRSRSAARRGPGAGRRGATRAAGRAATRPAAERGARREHRPQPSPAADSRANGPARAPPPSERRRGTRPDRAGRAASSRAQQAVGQRAAVGLLDMGAGVVDQVHVVHAGRAGRHAGQAGQAAVDVQHRLGRRPAGPFSSMSLIR